MGEQKKDFPLDCNQWAEVDFGLGPVVIRCTRTGEHEEHNCFVHIVPEDPEPIPAVSLN